MTHTHTHTYTHSRTHINTTNQRSWQSTLRPLQQYAELEFGDREMRPMAAPPNENLDVKYTEISKA